jgi:hypothetical protein
MAKPTPAALIVIYRRVLVKYDAAGDPMAAVQRRLIAALEAKIAAPSDKAPAASRVRR